MGVKQVINVKRKNNFMLKLFEKKKLEKKNEQKNIVIVHVNDEKQQLKNHMILIYQQIQINKQELHQQEIINQLHLMQKEISMLQKEENN